MRTAPISTWMRCRRSACSRLTCAPPAWTSWPRAPTSGCSASFGVAPVLHPPRSARPHPARPLRRLHVERELGDHRYRDLRTARRFDYATPAFGPIYQLGAALSFLDRVGVPAIEAHTVGLADRLNRGPYGRRARACSRRSATVRRSCRLPWIRLASRRRVHEGWRGRQRPRRRAAGARVSRAVQHRRRHRPVPDARQGRRWSLNRHTICDPCHPRPCRRVVRFLAARRRAEFGRGRRTGRATARARLQRRGRADIAGRTTRAAGPRELRRAGRGIRRRRHAAAQSFGQQPRRGAGPHLPDRQLAARRLHEEGRAVRHDWTPALRARRHTHAVRRPR